MSIKMWDDTTVGNNSFFRNTIAVIGGVFLGFIIILAATLYGVFAMGFVGMKLWAWFIAPLFGLKLLTITQAWGIAFFVAFLTHQTHYNTNVDKRTTFEKVTHVVSHFLTPWFILLTGWLIKIFIY